MIWSFVLLRQWSLVKQESLSIGVTYRDFIANHLHSFMFFIFPNCHGLFHQDNATHFYHANVGDTKLISAMPMFKFHWGYMEHIKKLRKFLAVTHNRHNSVRDRPETCLDWYIHEITPKLHRLPSTLLSHCCLVTGRSYTLLGNCLDK